VYKEVWGKTQGEVVKKLAAAGPPGDETTVASWVARWLETLALRPRSVADYRDSMTRFVLPAIGHLRVKEVTPSRLEHLVATLTTRGLAVTSIRKVLTHARIVFNAAVREGLITTNPASIARRPKAVKTEINPFTPDELAKIIEAATPYHPGQFLALLAGTGCRVGEALALDVTDFDPATGILSITKTYNRQFGIGPPKSQSSVRMIRVPAAVVPSLLAARGDRTSGPLYIAQTYRTHPKGMRVTSNRRGYEKARQAWQVVVKRCGLDYRNPHQLRHSVATALISKGVPIGDVAVYLGDTVETVVKTYLHPAGTDPSIALDDLLGGHKVGTGKGRGVAKGMKATAKSA
jgi:integrase